MQQTFIDFTLSLAITIVASGVAWWGVNEYNSMSPSILTSFAIFLGGVVALLSAISTTLIFLNLIADVMDAVTGDNKYED